MKYLCKVINFVFSTKNPVSESLLIYHYYFRKTTLLLYFIVTVTENGRLQKENAFVMLDIPQVRATTDAKV